MPNATNVTAGKPNVGGAIYRAPLGTALPTSTTETLNAAFKELGYASADGVVNTNTPETENIRAWGGQTVLTVQNSKDDKFTVTLIETLNEDVLAAVYGDDNVSGDLSTGITVNVNDNEVEAASWVFDMIMRDGAAKRIVIPEGKVTELGEITYADSSAVGYAITIDAIPDSSNNNHYEYILGAQS